MHTNITILLDRSGSMEPMKSDVEGGFKNFIEEQKKVKGTASITLHQFYTTYETVYQNRDINEVEDLKLVPRGATALLDAIRQTINTLSNTYTGECPKCHQKIQDKNIVVIITDGEENSSFTYSRSTIFKMISDKKEKGIDFVFLGANQDAIKEGASLNIYKGWTYTYAPTHDGYRYMFHNLSASMTSYKTEDNTTFFNESDNNERKAQTQN